MNIYPQDLGERRRALAAVQARQRVTPRRDVLALQPRTIVLVTVLVSVIYQLTHWGWAMWLALVAFPGVAFTFALLLRRSLPPQNPPLTPAQVQGMLAACRDPLESEYLRVVLAATQMPTPPEQHAQAEIREAVRALGAALDRSPPAAPARNDSAHDLVVQAAGLAVDADREGDPVVAASLRRRAESRREQAETLALLETMARRNAALRQELSDALDALHTSLAAFGAQGAWAAGEMADVAAGIGGIARKARAVAAAQAELDDALHVERPPRPAPGGPGGVEQRLRASRTDGTE